MKTDAIKNNGYIIIVAIFLVALTIMRLINYFSDPTLKGGKEGSPKFYTFTLEDKESYSIFDFDPQEPQKSTSEGLLAPEQESEGYFYLRSTTNKLIYVFCVSQKLYDYCDYGDKIYVEVTEMKNGELKYRIKGEIVKFITYKDHTPIYTTQ